MKKFEYRRVYVASMEDVEATLNQMGGWGWELVAIVENEKYYIFKRERVNARN